MKPVPKKRGGGGGKKKKIKIVQKPPPRKKKTGRGFPKRRLSPFSYFALPLILG